LSALREYHQEGRNLDLNEKEIEKDFPKFIQHFKDEIIGKNLKPGYVSQTVYWVVDKDGYAGRVSLRHELNDSLLKEGGHIGYEIRPSKRGQGYGNKALELVLPKARELGLEKVLVTCDSTNIASRKIIEANGGVLENKIPSEDGKSSKLIFWINTFTFL
jgi:predicted acetyltransferase